MKTIEDERTATKYKGRKPSSRAMHSKAMTTDENLYKYDDSNEAPTPRKNSFKKKVGVFALAASVTAGAYAFSKYENFKKEIANAQTEQQIATQLDHQGIIFNSVDVSGEQVITNIPTAGSSKNSFAFYTDVLPSGQIELYQNLSTASGETRHIYPITDVSSEHMAQKALQAVMGQSKK